MNPKGYLALILHAHLPFVRHPEYPDFLEEDWLYEAITETYLPLLDVMDGLVQDKIHFRLTMSITPPLCAMLQDRLLQERYLKKLDSLIELSAKEIDRTRFDAPFHQVAKFYHARLTHFKNQYLNRWKSDLVNAFKSFQDLHVLEIITCAATHGYLPLMLDNPESIRAQILIARDDYRRCFGRDPRGIWLPECAYVPGLEKFLEEAEIRWFVIDSHGMMFSQPRARAGIYAPVYTPSGTAAFARDLESSKQVWSAEEGYPGDFNYREFYRDVGFDLEYDYIRPYIQSNGIRKFTGLKYYRITGRGGAKEPYHPQQAKEKADEHAGNFMFNRERQIEFLNNTLGFPPIVVSPYDAELYGHWWFEGPDFLNFLLRKTACDQETFRTITPSEYLAKFPSQQIATPAASSWGNKGYWEVWLEGSNAWIYPHLHEAAHRMTEIATLYLCKKPTDELERAIRQAARELLLAQSSDWAFIMKTGTMVPYAVKRTKDHLLRFNRLYDQIKAKQIDSDFLANCEWRNNCFPELDWRHFSSTSPLTSKS